MEVLKPKGFYLYKDGVYIEYNNKVRGIGENSKLREYIERYGRPIKEYNLIAVDNPRNFIIILRKRYFHDSPIDYEWREEIIKIEPAGEKVTEWIHKTKGDLHVTNTVYGELWEVPKETREITIRYKEISDNMGHIREEEKTTTYRF